MIRPNLRPLSSKEGGVSNGRPQFELEEKALKVTLEPPLPEREESQTGTRVPTGNSYWRVRPHHRHSGATGAGLVEYTLWTEVVQQRGGADRPEVDLPGQPDAVTIG